ncbi:cytochrome c maturation protein CcmE [Micromonospora sp. WMMD1082]|uniref:cytochrome c maturation protein CcmE n=1 Tax=Micromonospora sp. WMMD1082 TaxID=3016104 RepID=UPI00241717B5|nr:cytochrome c maturation protein CcmE [Micromonospora sp. WMMD1082]MDG4798224.1 cytochrome c maturation protein CcmE [Micromonospora sp. WMMD1082]
MSRARVTAVAVLCLVAVGLAGLAAKGLSESVVYYRTPSEIVAGQARVHHDLRVAGTVVPGSVHQAGTETRLRLTDGTADIEVVHRGGLPGMFGEGRGAVVEGLLGADGILHAERVIANHDNEYRPAADR